MCRGAYTDFQTAGPEQRTTISFSILVFDRIRAGTSQNLTRTSPCSVLVVK